MDIIIVKDNEKDSVEFAHAYLRVRIGKSTKTQTKIQNKDTERYKRIYLGAWTRKEKNSKKRGH